MVPPLVAMLVVPATMPLPAEIATPLVDAVPRPPLDETTAQLLFGPVLLPVTTVLLEPPEPLTVAELLELVCATASVAPKQTSTPVRKKVFTMELHLDVRRRRNGCAVPAAQPSPVDQLAASAAATAATAAATTVSANLPATAAVSANLTAAGAATVGAHLPAAAAVGANLPATASRGTANAHRRIAVAATR